MKIVMKLRGWDEQTSPAIRGGGETIDCLSVRRRWSDDLSYTSRIFIAPLWSDDS